MPSSISLDIVKSASYNMKEASTRPQNFELYGDESIPTVKIEQHKSTRIVRSMRMQQSSTVKTLLRLLLGDRIWIRIAISSEMALLWRYPAQATSTAPGLVVDLAATVYSGVCLGQWAFHSLLAS